MACFILKCLLDLGCPVYTHTYIYISKISIYNIYIYSICFSALETPARWVRNKNLLYKSQTGINECLDKNETKLKMTTTFQLNLSWVLDVPFEGMFQKHASCTGFWPQDPAKNNQQGREDLSHKVKHIISEKCNAFWEQNGVITTKLFPNHWWNTSPTADYKRT